MNFLSLAIQVVKNLGNMNNDEMPSELDSDVCYQFLRESIGLLFLFGGLY